MIQPDALNTDQPLLWSPGTGRDVWAMFQAASDGDLECIKNLLARNSALARCHHTYWTPLDFAVRRDRREVAEHLLLNGARPIGLLVHGGLIDAAQDRELGGMAAMLKTIFADRFNASVNGESAAAAIREGDRTGLRELLDSGPMLRDRGDLRGNQPIHWATMTRQVELIDDLLDRGADVNARRQDGARPIQLVNGDYHYRGWRDVPKRIRTAPSEVLAHLRTRGAEVDLCTAAYLGDLGRVRECLDKDPNAANRVAEYVTYYPGSGAPLRNAAGAGHMEIVELLLDHGADPNLPEEGMAPRGHALYAAVSGKHFEIARLLLERGADPNQPVESSADPLSIALSNQDTKMAELLCAYGAFRSVDILAYYGDVKTAAAVFAANPDLADDPEAFRGVVENGHEGFVRLMLRVQPDLIRRVSVAANTRELTQLLLDQGMPPSLPDWLGVTPLHRFARRGDLDNALLFLDRGADLEARDDDLCTTPLGWAAFFGEAPMVQWLIEHGAASEPSGVPEWAQPLTLAKRRGHDRILDVLGVDGSRA